MNKAEETRIVQETPIQYATVTPGTVIAQVPPELAAGQYSLIIRTSPNEKDIKEAVLSDPVSVA